MIAFVFLHASRAQAPGSTAFEIEALKSQFEANIQGSKGVKLEESRLAREVYSLELASAIDNPDVTKTEVNLLKNTLKKH